LNRSLNPLIVLLKDKAFLLSVVRLWAGNSWGTSVIDARNLWLSPRLMPISVGPPPNHRPLESPTQCTAQSDPPSALPTPPEAILLSCRITIHWHNAKIAASQAQLSLIGVFCNFCLIGKKDLVKGSIVLCPKDSRNFGGAGGGNPLMEQAN